MEFDLTQRYKNIKMMTFSLPVTFSIFRLPSKYFSTLMGLVSYHHSIPFDLSIGSFSTILVIRTRNTSCRRLDRLILYASDFL